MIFDSDQQKNFILEAVRKYPTNYETALNLASSFGQAIQDGRIIDVKKQVAQFPLSVPKVPATIKKEIRVEDLEKVKGNGADAKEATEASLPQGNRVIGQPPNKDTERERAG